MGVDTHVLRLLCDARAKGISFSSTLMLGRQNYVLKITDLCRALKITTMEASALYDQKYVEPLLKLFGAARVESIDNSPYEGASIIHDLNEPVPEHLKASFSCVFDGGLLEHVFNFPQAIKNCMEMVTIGGHFLGVTVANNFLGHGFYQFSPELYYRVFSSENGYVVEDMLLCETDPGAAWYRVEDPETLGRRVELINKRPTYIMVVARRVCTAKILSVTPQQSDYVAAWELREKPIAPHGRRARSARSVLARLMPRAVKIPLKRMLAIGDGAFPPDGYRKV